LTCSYTPVIPALRRVRQEDHKFEASLGCIKMTLSQKKKTKTKTKNPQLSIFLAVRNTLIQKFMWECKKPRGGKAR
jgi:hypothetical protein